VSEPWDAAGTPIAPTVHRLKVMLPSVPIVVYCDPNAAAHREVLPLARAGIDAIMLRGIDDEPAVLRTLIEQARYRCVETEVLSAVGASLPPDAAALIRHCLRHPERVSIERAAVALAMDRKTLLNRLARHRLPPPREIAAWCRLLVAARLLEDPARTAEQVGLLIGCGSATALRNLFLRHIGLRPAVVRANGGMRTVLRLFEAALCAASLTHGLGGKR
jgi:AraC-like DNA-binding protein